MTLIRSLIFVVWMYGLMMVMGFLGIWLLLFPRSWSRSFFRLYLTLIFGGMQVICGLRYQVEGLENLPEGGALIASKHQAMFETLAYWEILDDPAIILKKELAWLPVFGWFAQKLGNIVVDRGAAAKALRKMLKDASNRASQGRQILIFPEGTRSRPGERVAYKSGVAGLYAAMNVPCVPVALDSGFFWQGRGVLRRPGVITVRFLQAIEPGLSREDFMSTLETRIETASAELAEKHTSPS
jgi:1-acyl-sn-glycerol-3-phosphate acyltransferase